MSIVNQVDIRGNTIKNGSGDSHYVLQDWEGRIIVSISGTGSGGTPIDTEESGHDAVGDFTATLTSAGTAQQLASNSCKRAIVTAHESNTGTVVIGGSTCVAALVGRRGKALFSTQSEVFIISNTNLLYFDSTVTGDKVHVFYEN